MSLREVAVDAVSKNPNNPRQNVRESKIDELAQSIDNQGLLQPPLVRPVDDGFELVHGERRLRAVERLGWDTVAVNVEDLSDADALEVSITENLQREDVTPIGEARSYQMLINEHELTQTEAADRLGVSQADISNKLGLLDLPDELQNGILRKILSPWQAKELARVWGDYWLFDLAVDWELSVREIRNIVDRLEDGGGDVRFERQLSADTLGEFWDPAPDGLDGTTKILGSDGVEREVDTVWYLDRHGEPVTQLHTTDSRHGLLWASRTLEDCPVEMPERLYEDFETPPIRLHWPMQRLLVGYNRLSLAREYGYTGDFDVEVCFHTSFFEWRERVPATPEVER